MKKTVFDTLSKDEELISMLGKMKKANGVKTDLPAVFSAVPPSWEELPCVAFSEYKRSPALFADDVSYSDEVTFQVCICSAGKLTDIFERVRYLFVKMGFDLVSCEDITEPSYNMKKCYFKIYEF